MIKEFEKLKGIADVNINLQNHAEGVYARVVFIPLKSNPVDLKPREAWGTIGEVENFVRFALDGFAASVDHVETGEPMKYVPPPKAEKKPKKTVEEIKKERNTVVKPPDEIASRPLTEAECEVEQGCPFDEQLEAPTSKQGYDEVQEKLKEIVEESGIPKDNIIIASSKPLPKAEDIVLDEPNTLIESAPPEKKEAEAQAFSLNFKEKPPVVVQVDDLKGNVQEVVLKENVVRCTKCELPKGSVQEGECIYPKCPDEKFKAPSEPNTTPLTPEENKLRDAMIEDDSKGMMDELGEGPIEWAEDVDAFPEFEQPEPIVAAKEDVDEAIANNPNFKEEQEVEPIVDERVQMIIDEQNKKANEISSFQAPTFNFDI